MSGVYCRCPKLSGIDVSVGIWTVSPMQLLGVQDVCELGLPIPYHGAAGLQADIVKLYTSGGSKQIVPVRSHVDETDSAWGGVACRGHEQRQKMIREKPMRKIVGLDLPRVSELCGRCSILVNTSADLKLYLVPIGCHCIRNAHNSSIVDQTVKLGLFSNHPESGRLLTKLVSSESIPPDCGEIMGEETPLTSEDFELPQ